jgi:hypothetical protein
MALLLPDVAACTMPCTIHAHCMLVVCDVNAPSAMFASARPTQLPHLDSRGPKAHHHVSAAYHTDLHARASRCVEAGMKLLDHQPSNLAIRGRPQSQAAG